MNRILITLLASAALAVSGLSAQHSGPGPGPGSELRVPNPEVQALIEAFRAEQQALRAELHAILEGLEDPTREAVAAATQAFRQANADRIAAQRELSQQIREAIAQNRPDRPLPVIPDEVKALMDQFRAKQAEMQAARQELHAALEGATDEERAALLAAFREAQRERMGELKELRQQLRDLRGSAPGDRRPGG